MPLDTNNSLSNWLFDRSLIKEIKKKSRITSNENTSEIAQISKMSVLTSGLGQSLHQ